MAGAGVPGRPLAVRRTPLRKVSDKQAIRTAFLQGIKAERIYQMYQNFAEIRCEECKRFHSEFDPRDYEEQPDAEWIEEHMCFLDGHHGPTPRDKGRGYRTPMDHGVDSPTNIKLLCRGCHQATEPSPQWM